MANKKRRIDLTATNSTLAPEPVKVETAEFVPPPPPVDVSKAEKFCRMVKVHVPNSYWPAWQSEILHVRDGKIVKRELIGKPDTFEQVYAKAADEIDPRNDK